MAQINKPSEYFNTKLYTGTGAENAITGVGFQPDLTWIKRRELNGHRLFDSVRGATKYIETDSTDAEVTDAQELKSFDSDGFTLGTALKVNASGGTYASWNWLADNTSGSSNTDGSITSTVSANTTSGFSVVKWTGTGSGQSNVTIGHGLNATPKVIIFKQLDTGGWIVYHEVLGSNNFLTLNATDASTSATGICNPNSTNIVLPTSYLGTNSTAGMIAYCFAEKKSFSKFGSYTGNGSTDGVFCYTGMKPAWVLVKKTSATDNWILLDNKRDTAPNPHKLALFPNTADAESGDYLTDFLSNGFKIRSATGSLNTSSASYIYMAFAEEPLVGTNNIPATAR